MGGSSSSSLALDHVARAIVAPHRRAEEAEAHRLADDHAELLRRELGASAFLHAEGATHSALIGGSIPGTAGTALSMPT